MSRKRLMIIAGARPNFMKIAPLIRELRLVPDRFVWSLVHTGQHYDKDMSDVFFDELGIPAPDFHLDAGGGSHGQQTGRIMERFEAVCSEWQPDLVVVVGDVNSTLATAIVAKKAGKRVAHIEAGLRSGDMSMPEEINRIVTDSVSDFFFVTEPSGVDNLLREGHAPDSIFFVGHVMIDNLFYQLGKLREMQADVFASDVVKRQLGRYGVLTLHRPANVDDPISLAKLIDVLNDISADLPMIFVVHPRTQSMLRSNGFALSRTIHVLPPLPYMEFLNLWKDACVVLTDSGGLQEETTALGVPCVTLRDNTERPITVSEGSNVLAGTNSERIREAVTAQLHRGRSRESKRPQFWDGRAAERIVSVLLEVMNCERDGG